MKEIANYFELHESVKNSLKEESVDYHGFCGEENFLFDLFKHINSDLVYLVFEDDLPKHLEKKVKRIIIQELQATRDHPEILIECR
ncbi:hypothetical protein [Sphingobacterium sp. BN32]|uniref:hypothetical protein n=1 Tax=Sphingobacterium sp. BN32 TaxID=3058432 RepID=UPI00265D2F59|nr:hypothetical protein [Sphingobacterium sp. BN32]WKK60210.1 hypothetical protein QYC40_08170 [Sphingobacterium sp. BN32]